MVISRKDLLPHLPEVVVAAYCKSRVDRPHIQPPVRSQQRCPVKLGFELCLGGVF